MLVWAPNESFNAPSTVQHAMRSELIRVHGTRFLFAQICMGTLITAAITRAKEFFFFFSGPHSGEEI